MDTETAAPPEVATPPVAAQPAVRPPQKAPAKPAATKAGPGRAPQARPGSVAAVAEPGADLDDLDQTGFEDPPAPAPAPRSSVVADPLAHDPNAHAALPPDEDGIWDEAIVEDAEVEIRLPRIRSARVVYLGSNPRRSESMIGGMVVEDFEPDPMNAPGVMARTETPTLEGGAQCYDFSSRDNRGRSIGAIRMVPSNAPARIRNRPFARVEHPEHLRRFLRFRDQAGQREFEVAVPDKTAHALFRQYVMDKDRAEGRTRALADYAQGLRDTPE